MQRDTSQSCDSQAKRATQETPIKSADLNPRVIYAHPHGRPVRPQRGPQRTQRRPETPQSVPRAPKFRAPSAQRRNPDPGRAPCRVRAPKLAQLRPCFAKFGPHRPDLGQIWSKFGQCWLHEASAPRHCSKNAPMSIFRVFVQILPCAPIQRGAILRALFRPFVRDARHTMLEHVSAFLGSSFGPLRDLFGASSGSFWGLFGSLWGLYGPLWGIFGASLWHLRAP